MSKPIFQNAGKKKLGKAYEKVDSMLKNLNEGLEDMRKALNGNHEIISDLQFENKQINEDIHAAENFKANLERLKG